MAKKEKKEKKESSTPENLSRYTMQVDKKLYRLMKTAANNREIKTYQIANTVMLLGCKKYSDIVDTMGSKKVLNSEQVQDFRIDTKKTKLEELRKIVDGVIGRKSFNKHKV